MARLLFPPADRIILTRVPYARAAWPEDIRRLVPEFSRRMVLEPDAAKAVRKALDLAGKRGTVVITGSLFLVGAVKKKFRHF
jgi:dihydrofolate synthase/folylpolyglutamate synthase